MVEPDFVLRGCNLPVMPVSDGVRYGLFT